MTRNVVRHISRALKIIALIVLSQALSLPVSMASTNAQTFTYQGRFMNEAGTAPLSGVIDITFSIYDPAGVCLLYQETQTGIDLTSTAGVFSAQVGSILGASKRTAGDPGLSMAQIFANNTQIRASGAVHCTAGYTPASGDSRVLRVTILPHSTGVPTTITPDQIINSVPQAQTAETLQGLTPQSFIQSAAGVAGQANVSLTTLETLTGGLDASSLHNHDSLYVKIGTSGTSANLGTSAYTTSSSLGIGTANPTGNLSFTGSSGAQSITVNRDTTAGGSGSTLSVSAGGATSGASNQNGGNLVLSGGVSTGTGSSSIQFQTTSSGSSGSSDNNPSTKMILSSSGDLGVGTTNPGAQFEVDTAGAAVLGEILKGSSSQSADLLEFQNSTGSVLSKFDPSGYLTLPGSPTSALQAATKQYVDSAVAGATSGVSSFNTRTGTVTLSSSDVTTALTYTPLKNSSDAMSGTLGVGGAVGANTQLQSTSTSATNITEVLKEAASQSADIFEVQDSSGNVLSKIDSTGMLTLKANPSSALQAATKGYVDSAIAGATAGVATFDGRNGTVVLQSSDVVSALPSGLPVANGGTGLTAGTSGGIPYFSSSTAISSSVALTANAIILGGGAGASPTSLTSGTSGQLLNSTGTTAPAWTSSPTISGTLGVGGSVGSNTQFQSTSTAAGNATAVLKEAGSQTADILDFENSSGTVLSKVDSTGMLTLQANPTSSLQAATKGYVDTVAGAITTNWATPGTIGSTTPNTGAFTSLTDSGTLAVTGNVGIGTAAGSYPLVIKSGNAGFAFDAANQNWGTTFGTGGNFGIFAESPGSSTGAEMQMGASARGDNARDAITFLSNGTERMRIDGNYTGHNIGYVGINNATPAYQLDVTGSVNATSYYGDGSHLTGISTTANWAAPGTIGSTTPNTGAFTNLSTTGTVGFQSSTYTGDQVLIQNGTSGTPPTFPASFNPTMTVETSEVNGSRPLFFGYQNGSGWDAYLTAGACGSYGNMCLDLGQGSTTYTALQSNGSTLYVGGGSNADGNFANVVFGNSGSVSTPYLNVSEAPAVSGSTAAFTVGNSLANGNSNGTYSAVNSSSGYTGDLENLETNGVSVWDVPSSAMSGATVTSGRSIASRNSSTVNAATSTSFSIDMSLANVQVYSFNSSDGGTDPGSGTVTITLNNMVSGGSYSLVLDNSANSSTPTFSLAGCTPKYVPAVGPTTASTQTVYSILYVVRGGTGYCYTSWVTGF